MICLNRLVASFLPECTNHNYKTRFIFLVRVSCLLTDVASVPLVDISFILLSRVNSAVYFSHVPGKTIDDGHSVLMLQGDFFSVTQVGFDYSSFQSSSN